MKRGMSVKWNGDDGSLEIRKARGKLTVDEIEEVLLYGQDDMGQRLNGYYAIILKCDEGRCESNGVYYDDEPKGDLVSAFPLYDRGECPVCQNTLPPRKWCPNCNWDWKREKFLDKPDGTEVKKDET